MDGELRIALVESGESKALYCYTCFTHYLINTGTGFTNAVNSVVEHQRLFHNALNDFALW